MERRGQRYHVLPALVGVPAVLVVLFAAGGTVRAAADCPKQNDNGSIMCTGDNFWCGGTCQAEPSCPGGSGDPYSVKPDRNCGACQCACPADKPNDCTSTNQRCQTTNASCSGVHRQSVCDAAGGSTTEVCGSCVSGYQDCGGVCQPTSDPSCPAPGVWNACTKKCTERYILRDPGSLGMAPQDSKIVTSGDSQLLNGDVYFSSTKAIRVDSTGATNLNIGNWGTSPSPGFSLDIYGQLCLSNGASCRSDWPLGLPTSAAANSTLRFDGTNWVASSRLINDDTNVGIGVAAPAYSLDVRSAVGAAIVDVNDQRSAGGEPQLWTGYRISRGPGVGGAGTEKWFLGVNAADDKFRVQRNGTTSDLVIDSSGNVGVGTAAPAVKLHVAGVSPTVRVEDTGGAGTLLDIYASSGNGAFFRRQGSTDPMVWLMGSNERMRLIDSGNLGLGTSAPAKNLDIGGSVGGVVSRLNDLSAGGLWTGSVLARGGSEKWFIGMNDAADKLLFRRAGASNDLVIDTTGNVGVGTDTPAQPLDVAGTAQMTGFKMPTGAQVNYILTSDASGAGTWQKRPVGLPESATAGDTLRYDGSSWVSSSLLFNNAARIGIGDTAPGYLLDIGGSNTDLSVIRLYDSAASQYTGLRLDRAKGTEKWFIGMNDADNLLRIRASGATDAAVIDSAGNVGLGTGAPGQKLEVNGTTKTGGFILPPASGVAQGYVLTAKTDAGDAEWRKIIMADECTGGKYDHLSASTYDGNQGGYNSVNGICAGGTHICSPDEILRTVYCSAATLPASGSAWLAGGPPGFTSPAANDCAGFTSNAAGSYGVFWQFAGAAGGKGLATSCVISLKFACCKQ